MGTRRRAEKNVSEQTRMKHVAAYLLAQLGGNASPSESDITGILSSVGVDANNEKLVKMLSALEGKDLVEAAHHAI